MAKFGVTKFCVNDPHVLLRKHGTSLALVLRKFMFSKSVSLTGFFCLIISESDWVLSEPSPHILY